MLRTQTFDDGTTLTYDDAPGAVYSQGYTDTSGRTYQADTSVFTDFLRSILPGVSARINGVNANAAPIPVAPPGSSLMSIGLLGLGAFALVKALK